VTVVLELPTTQFRLLTVDEARLALCRSALECLRHAQCGPCGLLPMLSGALTGPGWIRVDQVLSNRHRQLLMAIEASGHGWIIDDEIAGIASSTGLDEGRLDSLDSIAQSVADADSELDDFTD
jgi:hypothetical protein